MKLIEALKGIKDLQRKANDLRLKVARSCAISSLTNPEYGTEQDQRKKGRWVDSGP